MANKRKVLVTGAVGNIGSYFAEHAADRYDLRLMVQEEDDESRKIAKHGEVVVGDITKLDRMKELCAGMDTVVHLAADPSPAGTWDSILPANIVGTYNTLVAARSAGCRRVVYASSIHAISGYPADVQVHTDDPPLPGDLYGVSKVFGEALAGYLATQEGLSCICIRIGGFQPRSSVQGEDVSLVDAWVSRRDLQQLIERCIEVDPKKVQFAIYHGLSNNRFKRMDISSARRDLGYEPVDDAFEEHFVLKELDLAEEVQSHSQQDEGAKSGICKDV